MAQFDRKTHRARDALIQTGRDYPDAWKSADLFRASRGEPGFAWPDWCFLPLAAAHAVVSESWGGQIPLHRIHDVARVGAMMAWRMTQGIYRFDPSIYEALRDTPVSGDIPADVLFQLPEWCVYIETPEMETDAVRLYGFWAHMEHDMSTGRPELRLLLDRGDGLVPVPLHIGQWSLSAAVDRAMDLATVYAASAGASPVSAIDRQAQRRWAEPLVSLLLYLCSSPDFSRRGQAAFPVNPQPKRTKQGWRMFASSGPTEWDVGVRMGAALRAAYQQEQADVDAASTGRQVRPHVRRAHWHTFLSGPKMRDGEPIPSAERRRELRWVPPIPVNIDGLDELPAVIRKVK